MNCFFGIKNKARRSKSNVRVGDLNHRVETAAPVQHLVAHRVGADVVAHDVL